MPTRRIFFNRLELDARIGILDHELRSSQPLHIDAEFDVAFSSQVSDHDIGTVLDYRKLRHTIIEACTEGHVNLLETLSENIVAKVFRDFPDVLRVKLRISKPQAFDDCAAVGIELDRNR